jgi:hypothetical protein
MLFRWALKNSAAEKIVNIEKKEFGKGRELPTPESFGSINLMLVSAIW